MEGGSASSSALPASRGRGRGKSRGGLGKYLRARGRGRGRGRGAVWNERSVLENEQADELEEAEQKELEQKFARRQLGTNADRYAEPEPELDSDGEEIVEPEVDLSSFIARQRLADDPPVAPPPDEDDDIDYTLTHHNPGFLPTNTKKGKVQQIEWDASLEELTREKAAADATRDLKTRFRAQTANERARGNSASKSNNRIGHREKQYIQAPALPPDTLQPVKSEKVGMEDFLDDLLG